MPPTLTPVQKATFDLPTELVETTQEAVRLGLAESASQFVEEALRRRAQEVRDAKLLVLAREAMSDPNFVADMRGVMSDFAWADAEAVRSEAS